MNTHFEVIGISSKGEALEEVAKQTGIQVVGINMTRKITPLKDLIALWKLYKFLKKEKPSIVHTHTPKAGILGMLAAYFAGVPVRLHTVAGMPLLEASGLKRMVLDNVEKLTYICATQVFPNSFRMKDIIIKNQYCDPKKLKVIGNGSSNGIDIELFDPKLYSEMFKRDTRKSLNIGRDDFVLCFIGRMVKDKGIKELVSAFIQISTYMKGVKLLLLGPFERDLDPLDKYTEQQILNNPSIIWVDFQKDVRPYLAISDLFVFPSYREGFPNVVLQAGAMGLPCIVSDINGCNEIIENGKNGLIIPAKNTMKLQQAIEQLISDDLLRTSMASVSRQVIIQRYDQGYLWNELLKEYNLLVDKKEMSFIF